MISIERCPHCDYNLTRAVTVDGSKEPPREGEIVICGKCGDFSIYEMKVQLRKPNPQELESITNIMGPTLERTKQWAAQRDWTANRREHHGNDDSQ